jgi:hypothetical protein
MRSVRVIRNHLYSMKLKDVLWFRKTKFVVVK